MKADVFHAYLSLLKQTRPAQSWLADPDAMEQGETPLTMLQSQVMYPVTTLCLRTCQRSALETRRLQFGEIRFWD